MVNAAMGANSPTSTPRHTVAAHVGECADVPMKEL
jgi:hypothetical protein